MTERHESDNLSMNYCEYLTKAKIEGNLLIAKTVLIIFFIVLVTVPSLFILKYMPIAEIMYLIFAYFIYWFLSRYVYVEYEYTISGGEITVDKIYGKRTRKTLLEIPVTKFIKIAPFKKLENKDLTKFEKVTFAASSKNSSRLYYIIYTDKNEKESILLIDVYKKSLDVLKFYRPSMIEIDKEIYEM